MKSSETIPIETVQTLSVALPDERHAVRLQTAGRVRSRPRVALLLPGFCADESDWCIPAITSFVRTIASQVDMVIYTGWPYGVRSYSLHGALVHTLSRHQPRGVQRLMLWREYWRRICSDHAVRPFDLLHAFWATEPGLLATSIASGLGIPSIVSLAGGELAKLEGAGYGAQLRRTNRYVVQRSLAAATMITAGSRWLAEMVPPAQRKKLWEIPLGVDTGMFPPAPVRGRTRLLAAASMIPLKDYPTLLEAIAITRPHIPGLQLDLAGDGIERPVLESMVDALGLRDIVRFLGHIPYDQMPQLFSRHDLLLHCSLHEAQCMVVLEALATGMPVIASDVGIAHSLPDSLLYRFTPGNPGQLSHAIIRSLSDTGHAIAAATQGPELIRRCYSVEVAGEMFLRRYVELIMDN